MPRYERPPADMEIKSPALAVPSLAPPRPRPRADRAVIHEVVILPTGVDQRGDVFDRGALAEAVARRSPGVTIRDDWSRPVGSVLSAVELPAGDPRLPARQPTGERWPSAAGGLLLRLRLMPGTTEDSRLAIKSIRRNGARQRWTIGFRVLDGEQTGRLRRIRRLDVFTISPVVDEVKAAGRAPSRQPGVEIKSTDTDPSRPGVRGPLGGLGGRAVRLELCGVCGKAAGLPGRSTVGRGRICDACVDLVDPILDDPDAFDPTPQTIYDEAIRNEQVWGADAHGGLSSGPRDRRWRP